ncbi:MAG: hypothetical protein QM765_21715 [Myxococcales bacterium]
MSTLRVPLEKLIPEPADLAVLEERARLLANGLAHGASANADAASRRMVVRFRVGGNPLAIAVAELVRAVTQLGAVLRVPDGRGGGLLVAFLQEKPVPVFDLHVLLGQACSIDRLMRGPALLLRDEEGPIACAVEGPLELAEVTLTHTVRAGRPFEHSLPLEGLLSDGASLLEPEELRARASRTVRSA